MRLIHPPCTLATLSASGCMAKHRRPNLTLTLLHTFSLTARQPCTLYGTEVLLPVPVGSSELIRCCGNFFYSVIGKQLVSRESASKLLILCNNWQLTARYNRSDLARHIAIIIAIINISFVRTSTRPRTRCGLTSMPALTI